MKLLGGFLITLAVLWIWMILSEYILAFTRPGADALTWPDVWEVVGYLSFGILMLVIGVVLWRRKPKNWFW